MLSPLIRATPPSATAIARTLSNADALAQQRSGEDGRHQRRQRHQEENLGRASGLDGGDETNLAGHHGEHRDPGKTTQAPNLRERDWRR